MANTGETGGSNPSGAGTHPRMSNPVPAGPSSSPHTQGSSTGSSVTERIGDAWDSTRESMREGAQAVTQRAQNFWNDARSLIGRRPVAAIGIAFFAGWAVGCLTARRWREPYDYMTDRMSRSSA
jgi:ElaB/YqjD/DUF883 family membrane-anchored ribosome-binding protein